MSQIPRDETIEEIREVRHRISEKFGHDPARLLAYYMEEQEQYKNRFARPSEATKENGG